MTASRFVEEEHGTYTGRQHPHNGYYAGDFSTWSGRPGPGATFTASTRPAHVASVRVFA
jgi:hypothetical protein